MVEATGWEEAKRQVTVAMIAKHAGVSRVAVYAALNPDKKTTVGISEKTKNKILAAAEELGYIPNFKFSCFFELLPRIERSS